MAFFVGGQDVAHARRVDGDRLLHEDVLAGFDRRFEVHRAEAGRRGEDHQVGAAVDRLLVGVEADELPLLGHVDLAILEQRVAVAPAALDLLVRSDRGTVAARSAKASAIAHSVTGPLVASACVTAPLPRPPQPIRATLISSLP